MYILLDAPSITDWIQATSSVIGLIGLVFAAIQFFKKDIARQNEVDALMQTAKGQQLQIEELKKQTEALQRANSLIEIQIDQDIKKRKLDIMPWFQAIKFGGAIVDKNQISINLKNTGPRGFFNGADVIIGDISKIESPVKRFVKTDEVIKLNIILKSELTENSKAGFCIHFMDEEKNGYKQDILIDGFALIPKYPIESKVPENFID